MKQKSPLTKFFIAIISFTVLLAAGCSSPEKADPVAANIKMYTHV